MSDSKIMETSSLKDIGVVITRPKAQAIEFAKNLQKVGGCPFIFPLIEITPVNDEVTLKQLANITKYDLLIFVSSNAVEHFIQLVGTDVLKNKILVTVGKKTAELLNSHGLNVDFYPERFFNSEALLSIDEFKVQAKDKKIAIIRGASGRNYLKNNLIALGAVVDYINVYSRHCPQKDLDALKAIWLEKNNVIVLLTSASSTASFFALANSEKWINELTVLIGSPRMQHEIPKQFQGKILTAEDPSDETLLRMLTLEL